MPDPWIKPRAGKSGMTRMGGVSLFGALLSFSRIRRRRRGTKAERPQFLVEQHDGFLEGHTLAAVAGAGLAVPAGEELHHAIELRVRIGGALRGRGGLGGLIAARTPLCQQPF